MSSTNATSKEALAAPSALATQEQTTAISGADGATLLEEDGELEAVCCLSQIFGCLKLTFI